MMSQQQKKKLDKVLFRKLEPDKYLADFVKAAWHVLEPSNQLEWNWHLDVICQVIQDVIDGKIKRLIINVPPRSLKSLIVGKCLNAWTWIKYPQTRFMFLANDGSLAEETAVGSRDIIKSPWYQKHWGYRYKLSEDANQKGDYKNNYQGYRKSFSILSNVVGKGANIIVIDDPNDTKDKNSPEKLKTAINAYKALVTRLNDRRTDKIILIQQRVCEGDLTDHILRQEKGKWTVLSLPMEFIPPGSPYDKRTKEGELLFSRRFTPEVLQEIKQSLQQDYSPQFQQSPTPSTGVLFNVDNFVKINPVLIPWNLDKHRHWDLATTVPKNGSDPDYTVGVLMGIDRTNNRCFVLDVQRFRLEPGQAQAKILETAKLDGLSVSITVEEEKASAGKHLAASWATGLLQGFVFKGQAIQGDKVARARAFAAQVNAGNVYVPDNAHWLFDYFEEMKSWPLSRHKDQGDGSSGAFNELTKKNTLMNTHSIITHEITDIGITIVNGKNPGQNFSFDSLRDIGFISYHSGYFSIARIWLDPNANRHIVECWRRKTYCVDAFENALRLHDKRNFEVFGIDQKLFEQMENEINQVIQNNDNNPLPLYPIELTGDRTIRQRTALESSLMTERVTASRFIQQKGDVWSQILDLDSIEDDARDAIACGLILAEQSF